MKKTNKRASIFVYLLILINLSLIIWYVVFNNTYIIDNNISVWKNSEQLFNILTDKGNINLQTVKMYNSNWSWYSDFVSCPSNITMSWTTVKQENISSQMKYDYWSIYCYFEYNWENVKIFFDPTTNSFTKAYYMWELRDIDNDFFYSEQLVNEWDVSVDSTNTTDWNSWVQDPENAIDWSDSTHYLSKKSDYPRLTVDFNTAKTLSKIVINKKKSSWNNFWNNWTIEYFSPDGSSILSTITWVKEQSQIEIDFANWYFSTSWGVSSITIEATWDNKFLNITSLEIYEWWSTWAEIWYINTSFNDPDETFLSFDSTWIWWWDNIDDNMNSDNYRPTSTWSLSYPLDYYDDDNEPRLTIFWSISPYSNWSYYNVFWNNHETNEFINWNTFNDYRSDLFAKIWNVEQWNLIFDLFTSDSLLNYDIKLIEFDKTYYKNKNSLLPINIYESKNLSSNYWYLQLNWDELWLSTYKTWNEFTFDFKNKDYSVYLHNNWTDNLAYRITWEESTLDLNDSWRRIYINAIDDSKPWIIETLVNHIIIWGEKNYISENFLMVWPK